MTGKGFTRVAESEWLDDDLGSPAEIKAALSSLRWVNRLFGGNRMHCRLLRRAAGFVRPGGELHILEVAAGHADVLQAAAPRLRWPKDRLRLTLLDRRTEHLPADTGWPCSLPQPLCLTADALAIPLADDSADVVSNCLFLHHLPEEHAARYLREALRVARVAVVVNDLERHWLHYGLARLMAMIDPSRISRHDGPASVRQAYTMAELAALATATGHRFSLQRGFLFRLGLVVWK